MKSIRNLVPRRRPVAPPPPQTVPVEPSAPPPLPGASDGAADLRDLDRAVTGRDRVPACDNAAKGPLLQTMEDAPKDGDGLAHLLHPQSEGDSHRDATRTVPVQALHAVRASDDPAPAAIWALEGDADPEPVATPDVVPPPLTGADPGVDPDIARALAPRDKGSDRVRTRLLGFGAAPEKDAFAAPQATAQDTRFPVGWLVLVDGPGRGASFTLTAGLSTIGRGDDQAVRLDFGDTAISRSCHAAIAYDPEDRRVLVGHGGRANIVRLNGEPLLSKEPLENGDLIRLGKTTLRFVSLCGADFDWESDAGPDDATDGGAGDE